MSFLGNFMIAIISPIDRGAELVTRFEMQRFCPDILHYELFYA